MISNLFQCNQVYKRLYKMSKGVLRESASQTNGSVQSYPSCICTTFLSPFACAFHAEDYSIEFKSFLQLLNYKKQ